MEVANFGTTSLREEYVMKLWDNYILDNVVESSPCQVAIYECRTKRKLVSSDGFWIQPKELDQLIEGVDNPDLVYRNGVTVGGRHYKVFLADGKHGIYARTDDRGCTICRTFALIIVCVNDGQIESANCNEHIMKIGDFIRRSGL